MADAKDSFLLRGIPPGDYKLHVWIESVPQSFLEGLSRSVHFSTHMVDLGVLNAPIAGARTMPHMNMYGKVYAPDAPSTY